jgi:hypothetical protein
MQRNGDDGRLKHHHQLRGGDNQQGQAQMTSAAPAAVRGAAADLVTDRVSDMTVFFNS